MNSVKKIFGIKKTSNENDDYKYERKRKYGRCSACNRYNTRYSWCQSCDPQLLTQGWTSGNETIDDIIKSTQLKAIKYDNRLHLQWIPYDELKEIEKIGEGCFSTMYKVIWINGGYDKNKRSSKDRIVALKKSNNSKNISDDFLNEVDKFITITFSFYLKENSFPLLNRNILFLISSKIMLNFIKIVE